MGQQYQTAADALTAAESQKAVLEDALAAVNASMSELISDKVTAYAEWQDAINLYEECLSDGEGEGGEDN